MGSYLFWTHWPLGSYLSNEPLTNFCQIYLLKCSSETTM